MSRIEFRWRQEEATFAKTTQLFDACMQVGPVGDVGPDHCYHGNAYGILRVAVVFSGTSPSLLPMFQ